MTLRALGALAAIAMPMAALTPGTPAVAAAPPAAIGLTAAARPASGLRPEQPGRQGEGRRRHRRRRHRKPARLRAYHWALTQRGHPYVWGGTGPGYDCSGLVMMAYRHAGIRLPRTTYEMLGSRLLVRVRRPERGDLAFYGRGHVELFSRRGYTFGAHDSGSRVSLIHYGYGWAPTAFYRVR